MKKTLALVLCLILAVSMFAGCGEKPAEPAPAPAPAPADPSTSTPPVENEPEKEEIVWPDGKLTLYVAGNAGDPVDQMARCYADAFAEATGGEYEVVNEGTGDGERLFQMLQKAKPDGMTLMIGGAGQIMQYYTGVHQDNPADLTKYTIVGPSMWQAKMAAGLLTQPDAPYDDVLELAEYAKANPGQITCAMSSGTSRYLAMTRLLEALDIYNDVRIIEANSAEITTGLLGGTINIALMNDQYLPQYLEDGSLKPLILTRVDREYRTYIKPEYVPAMDQIPIFSDYGLDDYYTVSPMCVFGPAGMSPELCNYIIDTMSSVLQTEEWTVRIKEQLGGSNCYEYHSHEEMTEIMLSAAKVIEDILG